VELSHLLSLFSFENSRTILPPLPSFSSPVTGTIEVPSPLPPST
jgi:hypothetical protein